MNYNSKYRQQGVALIMSLLIVVVISILGVAIGQQVISLRKVSAVNYDNTLSISHAQSALAEAHNIITTNSLSPDVIQALSIDLNAGANWWRVPNNWASAAVITAVTDVGSATTQPAYLIEDSGLGQNLMLGTDAIKRRFYRVTAKAQGKGESEAFLQSYYATLE